MSDQPPFSAGNFLLGLFTSLLLVSIANIIAAAFAAQSGVRLLILLGGVLPGAVIAFLAWRAKKDSGFHLGVIIGACIVALIGGICGTALVLS